jgi:hypothetical protein
MTRVRRPVVLLVLLAAGGASVRPGVGQEAALPFQPAAADAGSEDSRPSGGPMIITTDTRAYCTTLGEQLDRAPAVPPDVQSLRREGEELCASGHVRRGINRLRHALMALRAGTTATNHVRDEGALQPNE